MAPWNCLRTSSVHLAIVDYEPKRRLILSTPKLVRYLGILLLIVGIGMLLFLPFAGGVTWLMTQYKPYIDVFERHKRIIFYAGIAVTPFYLVLTALVMLLGLWFFRRRREVEIDCSVGAVIEREQFFRTQREKRMPIFELSKSTCVARVKSNEGKRGGAVTSYAVNLVFRDGSIVNFESLDSRLPAMVEQVVPGVATEKNL